MRILSPSSSQIYSLKYLHTSYSWTWPRDFVIYLGLQGIISQKYSISTQICTTGELKWDLSIPLTWFLIGINSITVVVIVIDNIVFQRMAGHHIAILRIIRFTDALHATATSYEFKELKVSKQIEYALLQEDFWKYIFIMCHSFFSSMHLLCLDDQKTPYMDKL